MLSRLVLLSLPRGCPLTATRPNTHRRPGFLWSAYMPLRPGFALRPSGTPCLALSFYGLRWREIAHLQSAPSVGARQGCSGQEKGQDGIEAGPAAPGCCWTGRVRLHMLDAPHLPVPISAALTGGCGQGGPKHASRKEWPGASQPDMTSNLNAASRAKFWLGGALSRDGPASLSALWRGLRGSKFYTVSMWR